jgi:hypothetical protein
MVQNRSDNFEPGPLASMQSARRLSCSTELPFSSPNVSSSCHCATKRGAELIRIAVRVPALREKERAAYAGSGLSCGRVGRDRDCR